MSKILTRIQDLASNEGITIGALERIIGASKGVLSRALNNGTDIQAKWLEAVVENYPRYSAKWLLTGEGDMLCSQSYPSEVVCDSIAADEAVGKVSDCPQKGVPLIPIDAMAGFLNGEVSADERDCERVLIPGIKADYVVSVRGNSMEPHYFSGDLVACQVLPLSDIFFQWGKVYVIDTSLGVLLKKIKPGSNNDSVLLVSENPDFDPLEMPRANIYHVAMVTALVRLI